MKREIKFRAWDKSENRYREILSINYADKTVLLAGCKDPGYIGEIVMFENVILEQCTGLTDMKGKQIYEGDSLSPFSDQFAFTVVYDFGCFKVYDELNLRLWGTLERFFEVCCTEINHDVEVVGTIHEHPELLNTTKQ